MCIYVSPELAKGEVFVNRNEFLNQQSVQEFIDWLTNNLPGLPVALNIAASRYVPGGVEVHCTGVEAVLNHYQWNAFWMDPVTNEVIHSGNWESTRDSLQRLKNGLDNAVGHQHNYLERYCREVLRWGGVTGAIPFLAHINADGDLLDYLQTMKQHLRLDGDQNLEELNEVSVWRYDSGLTKVHALLDQSGSPIYDSRVGASIAMLYELHCQNGIARDPLLHFPVGTARGGQIRNPGQLGLHRASQFYTARVPHHTWAQAQLKLGWILRAVIENTELFLAEESISARCHALEATLFMLGYDLRCIIGGGIAHQEPPVVGNALSYVPTGFTMNRTVDLFFVFAEARNFEGLTRADYVNWQVVDGHVNTRNAASANAFPLKVSELDLYDRDEDSLRLICGGGNEALEAVMHNRYPEPDSRDCVCLIDCLIVGQLRLAGQESAEINETIIQLGYAGTVGAANTLVGVANSVGRFFGLFDHGNQPTDYFAEFFDREGYAELLPELVGLLPEPAY
jgi:hypothetical protein